MCKKQKCLYSQERNHNSQIIIEVMSEFNWDFSFMLYNIQNEIKH